MMLSPKTSTTDFPTFSPTLSLQAGEGMHKASAIASVNSGLLKPSGPGKLWSQQIIYLNAIYQFRRVKRGWCIW